MDDCVETEAADFSVKWLKIHVLASALSTNVAPAACVFTLWEMNKEISSWNSWLNTDKLPPQSL
jgi:hypothetical protein